MTEFDSQKGLQRYDLFLIAIQQAINKNGRTTESKLVNFLHGLIEAITGLIGHKRLVQGHGGLKALSLVQIFQAIVNRPGDKGTSDAH